jgi:sialate O-acetylesterase
MLHVHARWGTSGADVAVSVTPGATGTMHTTVAGTGIWKQALPAMASGFTEYNVSAVSGGQTVTLTRVLFGKSIMCSGQSNIATISVKNALNATAEIAAAPAFTHVRLLLVAHDSSDTKEPDLRINPSTPWSPPTATNILDYSATCWFVARDLFNELGGTVPVGVVQSASGGTAVRNWAPIEALAKCPQPYNSPAQYGTAPYVVAWLIGAAGPCCDGCQWLWWR